MTLFLNRWITAANVASTFAARSGGILLLVACILTSCEVVLRKVFGVTLGGAEELSGYAFAIATSWALSFALVHRANVRVDALYSRLPRPLTAVLDVLTLLSLAAFVGYLGYRALGVLQDSLLFSTRATTPIATPLWIPQSMWVFGYGLFLFTIVALLLRTTLALFSRDYDYINQLAGARSLEEEAEEEIRQAMNQSGTSRS